MEMRGQMFLVFAFLLLSSLGLLCRSAMAQKSSHGINGSISVDVGVVLDLETWVGKMSMSCISMAISDFYATHSNYTTRLVLHTRDSKSDVVAAASAATNLLKNEEAQVIIGPQNSEQAQFVARLGDKVHVPIVSFSATSLSLSFTRTPYFIRIAQNDSSQVKAIAAFVRVHGWMEVVPIYEDTEYSNGLVTQLTWAFQEIGARFPYTSMISPLATDDHIRLELYRLMAMHTRVFIVHASASLGSRIFLQAQEMGMMSQGYVWIVTDEITNHLNVMDYPVVDSMQGVVGVEPYVPKSQVLENFTVRWKRKFRWENPNIKRASVSIFGLWAYDTVRTLAMAAERVVAMNSHLIDQKDSSKVVKAGQKLRDAILETEFKDGLSGEFRLVDGQLQSSAFAIVNVVGNGARAVGYWTQRNGISMEVNEKNDRLNSASVVDMKPIIWPGDSTIVPKGWVASTSGKKLQIAVPVTDIFPEMVNVEHDQNTNSTIFSGFCIDVFRAVVESLPFAVPYEFVPFEGHLGRWSQHRGSYDEIVQQVYLQRFDAAVADIMITANRSSYVDFTAPYSEPGVAMLAPIIGNEKKNAWIFLKPWSLDLWLTSGAAFIFTGFVVWVLEHRINKDFRGSPTQQLGTMLCFSFSTFVFAHQQKLVNNLSRMIVIIWAFFMLILNSNYTASLTSLLTVQSLRPTTEDVNELIKNGERVGYSSPVVGELLKGLNFDESNLRRYNSPEEYAASLSKGNKKHYIPPYFDAIPYIKIMHANHCSKYSMVRTVFRTGGLGFGFVFPKGSPLVPYLSRAILKLLEENKIAAIERHWFESQNDCNDEEEDSNRLSVNSFWGLFLITGIVSSFALFTFVIFFLYRHRHIITETEKSVWERLISIVRHFDEKDQSCHNFKNEHIHGITMGAMEAPTHIVISERK